MTVARLGLAIVLCLACAACGGGSTPPGYPAQYAGVVQEMRGDEALVVHSANECGRVLVGHDSGTEVLLRTGADEYEQASWDDVKPGRGVTLWVGDVETSCPSHTTAVTIAIEPGAATEPVRIDEVQGTAGDVGLDSSSDEILAAFGAIEESDLETEPGISRDLEESDESDFGPTHIAFYGGSMYRYRDKVFLLEADRLVAAIFTGPATSTRAGVGVGSPLDAVAAAYPELECFTANEGSDEYDTFPACKTPAGGGPPYLWFGGDPVRSITLSRRPL